LVQKRQFTSPPRSRTIRAADWFGAAPRQAPLRAIARLWCDGRVSCSERHWPSLTGTQPLSGLWRA
jgi:hypothetical protein